MIAMSIKVPMETEGTGSVMSVMTVMSIRVLVVTALRPDAHSEGKCIRLQLVFKAEDSSLSLTLMR